ncbi:MAG: T9SS type A sorting domain-containing protein [Candidatus Kapabacteria bacterium]|nr:T9SS type A sorting domain-containing protein [Candidatus Kapabacteria bacterium]
MKNLTITRLVLMALILVLSTITALAGDLTVNIYDSQGNALSGAKYKVFKGPNYVGEYNAGATISLETGKSHTLFAHYNGTSTRREIFTSLEDGNTFEFKTTSVKFHFSGGYLNFRTSGSWTSFGKTDGEWNDRELFPFDFYGNLMQIQTGYAWNDVRNYVFDINYEGKTSIEKTIAILKVDANDGSALSGVSFRGGTTNPTQWHVAGSTNSNGLLMDLRDGKPSSLAYEANINNSSAIQGPKNPASDSYYLFKTNLVTLKLETCDGQALSGGNPRYGKGSNYSTSWFPGGVTNNDGVTQAEMFPGVFSFEMHYQATAQTKLNVGIPNSNTTLTWKTTKVTLNWANSISYGGNGDSKFFNKPSMELLPGTYNFNFRTPGNNYMPITIEEVCSQTTSAFAVKLVDSDGQGLEGGIAQYYDNSWKNAGTTNTNGLVFLNVDGDKGNLKFRMRWEGATQEFWQNIKTNPVAQFQTTNTTFKLLSSTNTELEGGAKFYSNAWYNFGSGSTTSSMQLLPVNHKFRVTYNGATLEKWQNVGTDNQVIFNTVLVSFNAKTSTDESLSGAAKYYSNAWYDFGGGTTPETLELLPVNHKFRFTLNGATLEKWQNVGNDPNVLFTTVPVTFKLLSSTNTELIGGAKFYSNAWYDFGSGSTTTSMELLPVNHKFRITYDGATQEKWQDVGNDNEVVFNTELVTIRLATKSTDNGINGGVVKYYTNSWKDLGTTGDGDWESGNTKVEMLPVNHKFRMTYDGQNNEKWHNIASAGNLVKFEAVNPIVTVKLLDSEGNGLEGGDVKYYAGSWKDFGTTDNDGVAQKNYFLEGNYKWRMTYKGGVQEFWHKIVDADENTHIVTFQTQEVTVELKNSSNAAITDQLGTVMYYAGSWKTFGTGTLDANGKATEELLPLNYKFRMSYSGGVEEKWQNTASANTLVTFATQLVNVNLVNSSNNAITDELGAVMYYAGSWRTFGSGTLDASGNANMELLPLNYKFRMNYKGGVEEKWQNTAGGNSDVLFQTANVIVKLENCKDGGISDGDVKYYAGSWRTFGSGTTDASGLTSMELLPLNYKFRMTYNGRSVEKWHNVASAGSNVDFEITKVKFASGLAVKYYTNTWRDYSDPFVYLLPGNYNVRFGSTQKTLTIEGCEMGTGYITLLDHTGAGLAGATVNIKPAKGGSWLTAFNATTDANGQILFNIDPGFTKISLSYNQGGIEQNLSQLAASNYTWQTALLRIKLTDCNGNYILESPGGKVDQGGGTWVHHGYTGTNGYYDVQLFPRDNAYKFRMTLNDRSMEKFPVVSAGTNELLYEAVNVTLNYPGSIVFVPAGGWKTFDKPSMWLLPGNYQFKFDGIVTFLDIEGCEFNKKAAFVKLVNSNNQPIEGAEVSYRYGWGAYSSMLNTNSSGISAYLVDNSANSVKFKVTYKGASVEKEQNISTNPLVMFNTVNVTAVLKDSDNGNLTADNWQYRYGWGSYSSLNNSGEEILPVAVKVKVSYKGADVEKEQNVGNNCQFDFATVNVTAELQDSQSGNLTADSWQYRYGWGSYSALNNSGEELLPVNVKVKVNYNSMSKEKEQNVGSTPNYTFTWDGNNLNKQIVGTDNVWSGSNHYPNPVTDNATINYSISEATNVRIYITDMFGNMISELTNEFKAAGEYQIQWNVNNSSGSPVSSGTYIYVIETGSDILHGKMQVVK